jgi:hypothetical protein
LPSFERCPQSPQLADDFVGIVINLPESIMLAGNLALPVHGGFQMPKDEADAIPGGPFRAIVLLLVGTPGYHPFSFNAAGQAIMLEPEATPAGLVRGYFNVDAFQMARVRPWAGRFFVSAYLEDHRTASHAVEISGDKK